MHMDRTEPLIREGEVPWRKSTSSTTVRKAALIANIDQSVVLTPAEPDGQLGKLMKLVMEGLA
jgi:hypothetical protein